MPPEHNPHNVEPGTRNPKPGTGADGTCLRIYVGEGDQWHGQPLYAALVQRARKEGLAGATVLRGVLGYGHASRLHVTSPLRLSPDLPILVEIVDQADRVAAFVEIAQSMIGSGLMTTEPVTIMHGK